MSIRSVAVSKLKDSYRRLWPSDFRRPFDELFPNAQKLHVRPAETVLLPEVEQFPRFHPKYQPEPELHLPQDFTTTLAGAIYCPKNNVVLDRRRRVVAECSPPRLRYNFYREPLYLQGRREEVGGYAAMLKYQWNAYYHTVVDAAPRLLSLWEEPYCNLDEIKLLCPGAPRALDLFFVENLAPPNCRILTLSADRLYEVEHLIFTPRKAVGGYMRKYYVDELRSRVLPRRQSKRNRRILISRQNARRRRISNLRALQSALKPFDFETVIPENLSMTEEIELFYDAEVIVGAHGSGLTNMIFADKASVIELFATTGFVPLFFRMSRSLGHRYAAVFGEGDDLFPAEYEVDIGQVVDRLSEMMVSTPS